MLPDYIAKAIPNPARCGGCMRILAAIHPPEAIRTILDCLALPSRPPPIARALPEREVDEHDFY
jgi:hypothetical protein